MKHNFIKILFASALLLVMSGCATQPGRTVVDHFTSFCTLAGAAVGGGGAAAISLAAGPIGAGVFVGALLGSLACTEEDEPMAVAAAPTPAPQPMAAAPVPELDSDGDGVIDRLDRCPDTLAGKKVDANGCPDILLTLTGINFKFDSSVIEPNSEQILNQAVDALNRTKAVDVRIEGHTDSTGPDAYNQKLSERRANAVKNYLVSHGIDSSVLTTQGMGEGHPVATNTTRDGRYQNRRVEFHVAGVRPMASSSNSPSNDTSIETWRRLDQTVVQF